MTPKEKAAEIVKQFVDHNRIPCALIVANETIAVLQQLSHDLNLNDKDSLKLKFEIMWWNDVKKQIEKL